MTEQQYRIIADRDKGHLPVYADVQTHTDRVTVEQYGQPTEYIVRIERPVPTTGCPRCEGRGGLLNTHGEDSDCPRCGGAGSEHPSVPTREQIAEMLFHAEYSDTDRWDLVREHGREPYLCMADAVLNLLNGADR